MHIRVIHGPNLNMLGSREPTVYGNASLEDVNRALSSLSMELECTCDFFQSNIEGEIVSWVQQCFVDEGEHKVDGLLLNLGAYTHTSIAIRDALLAIQIPCVEVHMSNVFARESFRHTSFVSDVAVGVITGFGVQAHLVSSVVFTSQFFMRRYTFVYTSKSFLYLAHLNQISDVLQFMQPTESLNEF